MHLSSAKPFVSQILTEWAALGSVATIVEIDHICYRTESLEEYQQELRQLLKIGSLLSEAVVAGRPIATVKLNEPLWMDSYCIDLIELPQPKTGSRYPTGWEHIEIVTLEPLAAIADKLSPSAVKRSGLKKSFNPELAVKLDSGSVKLHHQSLENVVHIENNETLWSFLGETEILTNFSENWPIISGTLPLQIATDSSDCDILMTARGDFDELESRWKLAFSQFANYQASRGSSRGQPYIVANFQYQNLPVELFAQKIPTTSQTSHAHFLIENRLLKTLGPDFKGKVQERKQRGEKTEPAFADEIKLKGDPYEALLKLSELSDEELMRAFKQ